MEPIKVCVYTVPGCEMAEDAAEIVYAVVESIGMESVQVRHDIVLDQGDAERKRFLGSPTVMIDGVDVDWSPLDDEFAYGCRLYRSCGRIVRCPSPESVRESLIYAGAKRLKRQWLKRTGNR